MSCTRVFLAVVFPPLAVLDYGCGSVAIVGLLSLVGWVPGVIAALVIASKPPPAGAAGSGSLGLAAFAIVLCLAAAVFLAAWGG